MLRYDDNNTITKAKNYDSIKLFINKGGIGDDPDILDSSTVLTGVYRVDGDILRINGIQVGDTLELNYRRQEIEGKKWFW